MKRLTTTLAIAWLAAGCGYGMRARDFTPAQTPAGVLVTVTTDAQEFFGELIEVRDSGLVVHTKSVADRPATGRAPTAGCKLRLLPYAAIRSSRLDQTSSRFSIRDGRAPDGNVRERLRLLSRFPQGLAPELLQKLLQACGQSELAGVTP